MRLSKMTYDHCGEFTPRQDRPSAMKPRILHTTAHRPGAIAIEQLIGDSGPILRKLTGESDWPLGKMRLVDFGDIDSGLAVRLTEDVAQLMPHGGPRVLQRLTLRLGELGAEIGDADAVDPLKIFPEAGDRIEALALHAMARAQSPLAVELLLDQPRRWRELRNAGETLSAQDRERSEHLNRLIEPPVVVLAGRPNVGKSTLSNALLGRSMSIAFDLPGTTRDYTAGRIDLAGLVVEWHDTPGIRATDDLIERTAIDLARRLIARADLLIAMAAPDVDWPDLPRQPDLRVVNKTDLMTADANLARPAHEGKDAILVSAQTGDGLAELVAATRNALVPPADLQSPRAWVFDPRLEQM